MIRPRIAQWLRRIANRIEPGPIHPLDAVLLEINLSEGRITEAQLRKARRVLANARDAG